ncbi:MAG: histidine kinase dimerization/phospho-acceptor domain-containing protein [Candidatus Scalindua sp.]
MKKDIDLCQKKLGQILVKDGKVKSSDVQNALSLQKDNPGHQPLGTIMVNMNLITKEELSAALNKQIESSVSGEKYGVDLSDDEGIKMIVNKYKETEYFDDLNELMGIVTHKVRNPLAGISAAVEVLRERVGKDDSNERFFKMIFKEVDRLECIVKDLFKTFSNK